MSTTATKPAKSPTQVTTGEVRLSYANLWEKKAVEEGQTPKYSVCLLINKKDTKTIDAINKAVEAAKQEGKSKWGGKIPNKLKLPLRDGDEEKENDENYAGHFFVNASSTNQPGIVDRNRKPILDQSLVYSGCFALAAINFYAFDKAGNKGIACGLNHILKTKDGEPLAGGITADEAFADVQIEDDDDL